MPPSGHLLEFTITAFVLIVVPGPSVLFVVSRGVALGRRAALATVAGNTGGVLVQAILVALGLGAIVERSDAVFTAIKLAGAVYLVVLGIRMIRRRRPLADLTDATQLPKGTRTNVREGFVVGLTNPKAAIIFTVVLPQFTDPARGHVPLQLLLLGGIFLTIGVDLRQRLGDRGRDGPRLARALARPARGDRRRRRAGADRPGSAARGDRPARLRLVAGGGARVERLPGRRDELPVVARWVQRELEDPEALGRGLDVRRSVQRALVLAAGADDELADAVRGVDVAVCVLLGEPPVGVDVPVEDDVGAGGVEGVPEVGVVARVAGRAVVVGLVPVRERAGAAAEVGLQERCPGPSRRRSRRRPCTRRSARSCATRRCSRRSRPGRSRRRRRSSGSTRPRSARSRCRRSSGTRGCQGWGGSWPGTGPR